MTEMVTLKSIIDHFAYLMTNMAELSPHVGKVVTSDEVICYYNSRSTDQLLNGIFINQAGAPDIAQYLTELMEVYAAQNVPYTVMLAKPDMTDEIKFTLDSQRLKQGQSLLCVGIEMSQLNPVPTMEGIRIVPVLSPQQYDLYIDILATGFELNEAIRQDFKAMLANYGQENSVIKHYIAYVDNKAAAVISTLRHGNVLGMYCGATLAEYRKMGICTELYRHSMEEAMNQGCTHCVYQSANPTIINYITTKFGFVEYGELLRFVKTDHHI